VTGDVTEGVATAVTVSVIMPITASSELVNADADGLAGAIVRARDALRGDERGAFSVVIRGVRNNNRGGAERRAVSGSVVTRRRGAALGGQVAIASTNDACKASDIAVAARWSIDRCNPSRAAGIASLLRGTGLGVPCHIPRWQRVVIRTPALHVCGMPFVRSTHPLGRMPGNAAW